MKRCLLLAVLLASVEAPAYPLDGYEYSGISRLEYHRRIVTGELDRKSVPRGARLPLDAVSARLTCDAPDVDLAKPDIELGRAIARTLGDKAPHYSISLIDLSDPARPVYAEHNADVRRNVGSVGKVLIATSWFRLLADAFPDVADRERVMRDVLITGDGIVHRDHHRVMLVDVAADSREYRKIREGDSANIWQWLDWTLSASSNSAAAVMQKELVLLDRFGADYPPSPEQETAFFEGESRAELGKRFVRVMTEPNERNGIDNALLRQGSVFTREGKRRLPGTNSYGNTREVVELLLRIETGRLVDEWSSRELKRLLYLTQRRIRYASHPALDDYAVFHKSGSLYKCVEEPGFVCNEYAGNAYNFLASMAMVEGPVDVPAYHYLVAVSSNVLRENSAVAHQTLALRIQRLIEARHRSSGEARRYPELPFAATRLIGDEEQETENEPAAEPRAD